MSGLSGTKQACREKMVKPGEATRISDAPEVDFVDAAAKSIACGANPTSSSCVGRITYDTCFARQVVSLRRVCRRRLSGGHLRPDEVAFGRPCYRVEYSGRRRPCFVVHGCDVLSWARTHLPARRNDSSRTSDRPPRRPGTSFCRDRRLADWRVLRCFLHVL